jgi:hypothetical protein
MRKGIVVICAAALALACAAACKNVRWQLGSGSNFFPLKPNIVWMYMVQSKSQAGSLRGRYVVTDRVLGNEYVPALKMNGYVVEEFYNFDRGGVRPIVYYTKDGFITRMSGLDYEKKQIVVPAWGRTTEDYFLPLRLVPDLKWSNKLVPFGKGPGTFGIVQEHRSFPETSEIVVPAGHFTGCIRIETSSYYEGGMYQYKKSKTSISYVDWYAPDVGLVRTIAHEGDINGDEMERVELIRFQSSTKAAASEQSSQPKSHS